MPPRIASGTAPCGIQRRRGKPDGTIVKDHDPETHLIPLAFQAAMGQRPPVDIFGTDYPTPDGANIRDYIHVDDLTEAHILALERLARGVQLKYNVGGGRGFSVREVIAPSRR